MFDILAYVFTIELADKSIYLLSWCLQVHQKQKLLELFNSFLISNITWIKDTKTLGSLYLMEAETNLLREMLAGLGSQVPTGGRCQPLWSSTSTSLHKVTRLLSCDPRLECGSWLLSVTLALHLGFLWKILIHFLSSKCTGVVCLLYIISIALVFSSANGTTSGFLRDRVERTCDWDRKLRCQSHVKNLWSQVLHLSLVFIFLVLSIITNYLIWLL